MSVMQKIVAPCNSD